MSQRSNLCLNQLKALTLERGLLSCFALAILFLSLQTLAAGNSGLRQRVHCERQLLGKGAEGRVYAVTKTRGGQTETYSEKVFFSVIHARENTKAMAAFDLIAKDLRGLLRVARILEPLKGRTLRLEFIEGISVRELRESNSPEDQKIYALYVQKITAAHERLSRAGRTVELLQRDSALGQLLYIHIPERLTAYALIDSNVLYVPSTQEFVIIDPF